MRRIIGKSVVLAVLLSAATASANPPPGVMAFVRDKKLTRYRIALPDLNRDGHPEALVYAVASADGGGQANFCGSGGCLLYVLSLTANGYRKVTAITITRPPIRVLPSMSHGWQDISVRVAGGGINPGYEARLRFNGRSYPSNPSMPPATRKGESGGEEVISVGQGDW
ncbi:hypothetical protein SAMN05518849_11136 [Sphingobium sp. AP50]|uniref:hypothetical protein n=1 Tax=Sphingobium sp. AP50 TaxID=1884369 RepID=UPI0008CD1DCF|nr:hypothetical protein [Sphingobium sp. AP50]SEJ59174.1 hypothetical protein SAMN05518849_10937 [Sphingobium sp. AP50]SEJ68433.1 hypothetical protein SAMN05518849_11136 [Sphingobium sp. AP50]